MDFKGEAANKYQSANFRQKSKLGFLCRYFDKRLNSIIAESKEIEESQYIHIRANLFVENEKTYILFTFQKNRYQIIDYSFCPH